MRHVVCYEGKKKKQIWTRWLLIVVKAELSADSEFFFKFYYPQKRENNVWVVKTRSHLIIIMRQNENTQ